MPVRFFNAETKFAFRKRRLVEEFLHAQLQPREERGINLTYIFCSDEYLQNMNRVFLKHDSYTDVITFPLKQDEQALEAEIYISVDRVKENAAKFSHAKKSGSTEVETELLRVMFHGVLHLIGYKDKTQKGREEMRSMEDKWLRRFRKFEMQD